MAGKVRDLMVSLFFCEVEFESPSGSGGHWRFEAEQDEIRDSKKNSF